MEKCSLVSSLLTNENYIIQQLLYDINFIFFRFIKSIIEFPSVFFFHNTKYKFLLTNQYSIGLVIWPPKTVLQSLILSGRISVQFLISSL